MQRQSLELHLNFSDAPETRGVTDHCCSTSPPVMCLFLQSWGNGTIGERAAAGDGHHGTAAGKAWPAATILEHPRPCSKATVIYTAAVVGVTVAFLGSTTAEHQHLR